ncbi:hypothetical protein BpHYR1_051538 [Brachionus plicatilis]|uniref:Uncharacterized protein n=1 Tax=Brachionus plicatilis TaxID=10195 RepID=A0A3M7SFE4_BRAPC|nr:hypothetical protein BpHYR1_051538 [Brachionus plicatilis]
MPRELNRRGRIIFFLSKGFVKFSLNFILYLIFLHFVLFFWPELHKTLSKISIFIELLLKLLKTKNLILNR